MSAKGSIYLDGIDIWVAFGIFVQDGNNDFLKIPKRKEPISHDWQDTNGLDVDLSRVFFEARDITLKMAIKATSRQDFWNKYNQFIAQFAKPYLHRFEITEFDKSYFIYYKECNSYVRYKRLDSGFVICSFTIIVSEPSPQLDTANSYIVDENGRFLIT